LNGRGVEEGPGRSTLRSDRLHDGFSLLSRRWRLVWLSLVREPVLVECDAVRSLDANLTGLGTARESVGLRSLSSLRTTVPSGNVIRTAGRGRFGRGSSTKVELNSRRLPQSRGGGSYLAVWTLVGVVMYVLYRPHGTFAAGAVAIAAGLYEFTPLKRRFRRCCRASVRSGFEFGLYCVGSSIGLMLVLVALDVMSVTWMSAIAVLVLVQKLLPWNSPSMCRWR